jgi:hypothetical protein
LPEELEARGVGWVRAKVAKAADLEEQTRPKAVDLTLMAADPAWAIAVDFAATYEAKHVARPVESTAVEAKTALEADLALAERKAAEREAANPTVPTTVGPPAAGATAVAEKIAVAAIAGKMLQ